MKGDDQRQKGSNSMSNEIKTPRITKAMIFTDIKAVLEGNEQPNKIPTADLIARLDKELEALAKKNASSSGDKKPTEIQVKNEGYKAQILDILMNAPAEGMTCSDIHQQVSYDEFFNVQKTASLLRQLGPDGSKQVTSEKGKGGRMMFKLA